MSNPVPVSKSIETIISESQLSKLIDSFLSGKSQQTIDAYSADLHILSNFTDTATVSETARYLLSRGSGHANTVVLDFKNWMMDAGYSSNTINRRLASVRSLVKLAKLMDIVQFDILVSNLKVQLLRDTRGPQNPDVKKILGHLGQKENAKNTRDTAIIRLLHDLALRASELVGLDLEDFHEDRKAIAVLGKGMREKVFLELPDLTFEALKKWIEFRGSHPGHLFRNFSRSRGAGNRLTRQGLRDVVIAIAKKAGVTPKTTHAWRHTSITQAIIKAQENGMGLEVVLDHSRHSKNSINLLMTYRDRIDNVQGKIANMVADQVKVKELKNG